MDVQLRNDPCSQDTELKTYRDSNQKGNKVIKDAPKKLEIPYLETVRQIKLKKQASKQTNKLKPKH